MSKSLGRPDAERQVQNAERELQRFHQMIEEASNDNGRDDNAGRD
jgi:hypothetical protein